MTVTTNEFGQQNIFAKEPEVQVLEVSVTHNEKAEKLNGRVAMLGVIAAIGAYLTTGQLIPGILWDGYCYNCLLPYPPWNHGSIAADNG